MNSKRFCYLIDEFMHGVEFWVEISAIVEERTGNIL
jgi:hypothetical protein